MAGRALKKRILSDVAKRGGIDYITDKVASGVTLAKLAEEYNCSRSYLSAAINSVPDYREALERARKDSADAFVEEGLAILDDLTHKPDLTSTDVSLARERVHHRRFMAGSANADRYGTKPSAQVTISLGDMHLDALRKNRSSIIDVTPESDNE